MFDGTDIESFASRKLVFVIFAVLLLLFGAGFIVLLTRDETKVVIKREAVTEIAAAPEQPVEEKEESKSIVSAIGERGLRGFTGATGPAGPAGEDGDDDDRNDEKDWLVFGTERIPEKLTDVIYTRGAVAINNYLSGRTFYLEESTSSQTSITGTEIVPVGTADTTNVSSNEALLINNIYNDLVFNNLVAGSTNRELPGIDLGAPTATGVVRVYWWNNGFVCSDYQVQGSNDAIAWTPVVTGLDATGLGGTFQDATVNTTFRYWRVFCVTGLNPTFVVISELEAFAPGSGYGDVLAEIYNTSAASDVDLLRLSSDVGGTQNVKFRVDSDGDVYSDGTAFLGGGADLAESYYVGDDAAAGDVVVFSGTNEVSKTSSVGQDSIVGIVSTKPSIVLGAHDNGVHVALAGRVPVNFDDVNGTVVVGDYLTSGPDGTAVKAITAGPVIGVAMADMTADGVVDVFINLSHLSGSSAAALTTEFQSPVRFKDRVTFEDQDMAGSATVQSGDTTVDITFATPFDEPPFVTATPYGDTVLFAVDTVATTGFTITLAGPAAADTDFNWIALAIDTTP